MSEIVIYVLIGRLLVHLGQKFPFQSLLFIGRWWKEGEFLNSLFTCDLCLGTWIYFLLAIFFDIDLFSESMWLNIKLVNWFLTGATVSFLVHVFAIGWNLKFGVVEI